jgi:hypothetical protein
MDGVVDAPEFSHRLGQPGRAIVDPESPHNRSRLDQAEFQLPVILTTRPVAGDRPSDQRQLNLPACCLNQECYCRDS